MGWTPEQYKAYEQRTIRKKIPATVLNDPKRREKAVELGWPLPAKSGYNLAVVMAYFTECGLPAPLAEYQFDPDRKWRSDFAWRGYGLCLEVQGGLFSGGAHVRGAALLKEHEKLNRLAVLGWRVLFVMPDQLCLVETVEMIRQALAK